MDHSNKPPATILVVEDEPLVRMISSDILTDAGFRVIEAHDAQEAVNLLGARTDVAVVFTDWNMPGDIDGIELVHLIQKRWPAIGTIVTSGKTHPAPGELPSGVGFLAKPYRRTALIEVTERLVRVSDKADQGAPVLPEGIRMLSPVTAEVGGLGIAAAQPEPDKS